MDENYPGLKKELFDVIWQLGQPEYYPAMLHLVEGAQNENDPDLLCRLARLYKYGKGVERDVNKSISLYRLAAKADPIYQQELQSTLELMNLAE